MRRHRSGKLVGIGARFRTPVAFDRSGRWIDPLHQLTPGHVGICYAPWVPA
jgi:hypothetical protein